MLASYGAACTTRRTPTGGEHILKIKITHVAAGAAVAGFLALGGITLAAAQDAPGTTVPSAPTTHVPATPGAPGTGQKPSADDPNCPNMGGAGGTGTGTKTGTHGPHGRGHGPQMAAQGSSNAV